MLYIAILTWEAEKTEEVARTRQSEKIPEGIKMLGMWKDLGRGRVFRLFETDNPKAIFAMSFVWKDVLDMEIVPVMETEEIMKLMQKM